MGLVLVGSLLMPLPVHGRAARAVFDLLHAPAFALFAAVTARGLAHRLGRPGAARWVGWLIAVALGATTEFAQGFVGRHPGWEDLAANVLGATAGALWAGTSWRRWTIPQAVRLAAGALLLGVASFNPLDALAHECLAWFEMPRLTSFERAHELARWSARECRMSRVDGHATHGAWALRLDFEPGRYPGVALRFPPPDWSGYEQLLFDVHLDDGPDLDLVVKICDASHNGEPRDRFQQRVGLAAGHNEVRVDLADVRRGPRDRELALERITLLQLFTVRLESPRTVHLDNVRLR